MINIVYWIAAVLIAYAINSYSPVDSTTSLWINSVIGGTVIFVIGWLLAKYKPWDE